MPDAPSRKIVELPLKDMKKEALAELEGAIQYALKEKGHKKIEEN